jgi:uncharacterized membrane protein YfcA
VLISLPLCPIALVSLAVGFRVQRRIQPEHFLALLRIVLWGMAATLCWQAARGYFR